VWGDRVLVDQGLVNLVAEDQQVSFPRQGSDGLELLAGEHLANGVVGCVEDDHLGAAGD